MKAALALVLFIQVAFAWETFRNVIVMDDSNFEDVIATKGKFTFINFYSKQCEHCQSLAPRYEALATAFNGTDVQIAHIEGRQNRRIRNQEKIVGFPTLRLYYFDGTHVASFANQDRTSEQLAKFITDHTGVKPKWPESKVTYLETSEEVEKAISQNKKRVAIAFIAPWLQNWEDKYNEFDRLADKFPDVKFYRIDATAEAAADIVSKYRVSVFPTIIYFDTIDAPKFRMLEEHNASQKKMENFLMLEIGDEYENYEELVEEKSNGNGGDGEWKPQGVLKAGSSNKDEDEEEKYRKLREL